MRSLLACLLLFCFSSAFSQSLFQQISFDEALKKAGNEGKHIFLQFESATCAECNEVANKGLSDAGLMAELRQTFILLKISPQHPERQMLARRYNMQQSFGTLFINPSGTLIHKYLFSTSASKEYLTQTYIALQKGAETLKINELEKEYNKGNKSLGVIEQLLLKQKSLNLSSDTLLEEYVSLLPVDSQKSVQTLVFIAQMAPLLGSNANAFLRRDGTLFNQAWFSMNLQERITLNNAIIYKSLSKAIEKKEEMLAKETARFARSTHANNNSGLRVYSSNMLRFYELTGDTTNYFPAAIDYYNRYYMTVAPDSVKRADSLNKSKLLAAAVPDKQAVSGNGARQTTSIRFAPATQTYTNALNGAALNFYKMTTNPVMLQIATEWIKRGLEFYESPEALNTYARLLYKQGNKKESIEAQAKAINLKKERGYTVTDMEAALHKMKQGVALEE